VNAFIRILVLLLVAPVSAQAQSAGGEIRGQGYVFIAPIVASSTYIPPAAGFNTGFGGDILFMPGAGVGAELGLARSQNVNMGVGSINFSYRFLRKRSRVELFVSGGPSIYFGQRSMQTGFNLGGGVNLWAARHVAFRIEFRDNWGIHEFEGPTRFAGFRMGLAFR